MPRTLNDIIPPSRRRQIEEGESEPSFFTPTPPIMRPPMPVKQPWKFPYGTAIIVLIIIALVAGGLYLFSGAKIEITPAQNTGTVNATITAGQSGNLPFQIVTATADEVKVVPAESTSTVSQSAQGTITIYNTQSVAQQLVAKTRFETAAGVVFRIHSAVTVPSGNPTSPGSVTATVYADQPGSEYNIPASSFTLPGLSGSPAFAQVYAKSTAAMAGGSSGARPAVSDATTAAAQAALQAPLASDLATALTAKVPSGYVLVPGATFTSYTAGASDTNTPGSVGVHESGTAQAVVFPSDAFAQTVASQLGVSTYTGQAVTLSNVSGLSIAPTLSTAPTGTSTFQFSLTGSATITWKVDASKIAGAVAGKTRDEAKSILNGFPEVSQAYIVLRPFWVNTLPSDPSKIAVVVQ